MTGLTSTIDPIRLAGRRIGKLTSGARTPFHGNGITAGRTRSRRPGDPVRPAEKILRPVRPATRLIALTWPFTARPSSTIRSVGTIWRQLGNARHLRVLPIVGLAVLALLVILAGYAVLTIAAEPTIEEKAHSEAVRRAGLIGDVLMREPTDEAAELAQRVARETDVEVLRVDGTDRRRSPGVRLVYRVRVALSRPTMAGRAAAEVAVCFRQVLDAERSDYSRAEIPCPPPVPDTTVPGTAPAGTGAPGAAPLAPGSTPVGAASLAPAAGHDPAARDPVAGDPPTGKPATGDLTAPTAPTASPAR